MSNPAKFVHDDLVKVTESGKTGKVKAITQGENGYVYGVHLGAGSNEAIEVAEEQLELVKIANEDETGFAIRYIS